MPTFTLFGNDKIVFRIFEPLETSHQDDRYVDSGVEIDGRKHTIGIGAGSPLFSARGADVTGPIVDKCTEDKSKDSTTDDKSEGESEDSSPSSEKTEGETPPVKTEVVPSSEETSVDTKVEAQASPEVETEEEATRRRGEEALNQEDDHTGQMFTD